MWDWDHSLVQAANLFYLILLSTGGRTLQGEATSSLCLPSLGPWVGRSMVWGPLGWQWLARCGCGTCACSWMASRLSWDTTVTVQKGEESWASGCPLSAMPWNASLAVLLGPELSLCTFSLSLFSFAVRRHWAVVPPITTLGVEVNSLLAIYS